MSSAAMPFVPKSSAGGIPFPTCPAISAVYLLEALMQSFESLSASEILSKLSFSGMPTCRAVFVTQRPNG